MDKIYSAIKPERPLVRGDYVCSYTDTTTRGFIISWDPFESVWHIKLDTGNFGIVTWAPDEPYLLKSKE